MDYPDRLSQKHYDILLTSIDRRECAIFIGAGISIPIGYPSLQGLLKEMAKEANIAELQEKELDQDWMKDFLSIKKALGSERYQEYLRGIFDHTKRDVKFNPILLDILSIPFCAFVTTNYDQCLEFATKKLPNPAIKYCYPYPNLPTSDLKGHHIFHPHGYIDPNNPNSINSIILSDDEFADAYEITSNFFTTLFLELDILFIGFGWNDMVILDIIEKTTQTRKNREGTLAKKNLQMSREKNKFALIDNDTYQKDTTKGNYITKLGILPIVYKKTGGSHDPLNQIIEKIQMSISKTPVATIPALPEGFFEPLGGYNG